MYTPTRIAGREAVVDFLPEKLRAYPFIYIDNKVCTPPLPPVRYIICERPLLINQSFFLIFTDKQFTVI